SWAVTLHENALAIEQWRSSLSERERKRLVNPQSVVRRWQKETRTALGNGKCPTDLKREAKAASRRFVWCVKALPTDEAAPLWQAVLTEVAALGSQLAPQLGDVRRDPPRLIARE